MLAPMLLGLARTLSLGAWGGFIAAALTITATKSRRTFGVAITIIALAGALTIALLPHDRVAGRWDPSTGTALFRLEIWQSAIAMIADHPVLGLGLDNFIYAYQGGYMRPEAWREPNISHPHNLILDFWIQMGLPGLAAAGLLLAWVLRTAVLAVRRDDPFHRVVGAAALGVTVDFLVHGSVDNSYFLVDSATIWWITLAILVIGYPEPTAEAQRRTT